MIANRQYRFRIVFARFNLSEIFQFSIYLNSHLEGDTFNGHLILYHVSRRVFGLQYINQQINYWIWTKKIEW